jgi:PleD family two-component response regulator
VPEAWHLGVQVDSWAFHGQPVVVKAAYNGVMSDQPLPLVSVVDDQQIIADTLALILSKSGFRAVGYTNPVEAMHAAESDTPSLLIADVSMPGMNGIELAIHFKLIYPLC